MRGILTALAKGGRYAFKFFRSGARKGGKWIARGFGVGAKSARSGSALRKLLLAADIGFMTWYVYDWIWGDEEGSEIAANDFLWDQLLNEEVSIALGMELNDPKAVCYAFAQKGMELLNPEIDGMGIRGISYLGAATYLQRFPSGRLQFTAEEIDTIITEQTVAFLTDGVNVDAAEAENIREEIGDMDYEEMDYTQLRKFDFMASVMNDFAEAAQAEASAITQPGVDVANGGTPFTP